MYMDVYVYTAFVTNQSFAPSPLNQTLCLMTLQIVEGGVIMRSVKKGELHRVSKETK